VKSYCKGLSIDAALVREAYELWASGGAGRKNAWRVEREHGGADALVAEIAAEIRGRRLNAAPIRYRSHTEPSNGKVREIAIESVKQQVVDYVFHICVAPLLDAKIGYYQTASIPGKGQVWAMRRIRRWLGCTYWLKTDIRKCYPSTSHEVCMRVLRKYVRSDDVLYVAEWVLSTYREGLNIGSRFSLDMTNLILSFAYHHIEGLYKERRGRRVSLVRHQIWFMDDCLMMGDDKRDLKMAARSLARFLKNEFGLDVKPWKVCRTDSEPITMCGFTFRRRGVTVSQHTFMSAKRTYSRFYRRRSLKQARRACSYYGWLKHSDSFGFMARHGVWKALAEAKSVVSDSDRRTACESIAA